MPKVFKQSNVTLSTDCLALEDTSIYDDEQYFAHAPQNHEAYALTDESAHEQMPASLHSSEDEALFAQEENESDDAAPQLYRFPTLAEVESDTAQRAPEASASGAIDAPHTVKRHKPSHENTHITQSHTGSHTAHSQAHADTQALYDDMVQKAVAEASRILSEAHDKAQSDYLDLMANGEQQIEAEREKARQEGFTEGMRTQMENVRACIRALENAVAEIEGRQEVYFMEAEADLKWLALAIADKIMCARCEADETAILPLIKQAMAGVKNAKWLSIEISKDAKTLLERLQDDIAKADPERVRIETVDAPQGTCRIATPEGFIDASIYRQLENLRQYFESQA